MLQNVAGWMLKYPANPDRGNPCGLFGSPARGNRVAEMPLAGQCQTVLLLAERVLIQPDVRLAVARQEGRGVLDRLQHLVADIVDVDVDTDGADHSVAAAHDRDRGALEAPRADIELVVHLFSLRSDR